MMMMTTGDALRLAQAVGDNDNDSVVGPPVMGPGPLIAFGIEQEIFAPGPGPVIVNRATGQARQLGSLITTWPEWLRDA